MTLQNGRNETGTKSLGAFKNWCPLWKLVLDSALNTSLRLELMRKLGILKVESVLKELPTRVELV